MLVKIMWYVICIVFFIGLMWGGFVINRWFNFNFGYATHVRAEVCRMVKPEYLRDSARCK